MSDKEKNEINYKKVNEVVSLSSKILKIFYLLIIILGIYGITLIIEKWKIMEFIGSILKILTPVFIGFVVYWLFKPLVNYLETKKVRRGLSILAIYVVLISLLYLLVAAIIPILYEQVSEFAKSFPTISAKVQDTVNGLFDKLDGIAGIDFDVAKSNLFVKIEKALSTFTENLPNTLISIGSSIISGVGTFLIGLIVGVFLQMLLTRFVRTLL